MFKYDVVYVLYFMYEGKKNIFEWRRVSEHAYKDMEYPMSFFIY